MTAILAVVALAVLVWTAALLARGGPLVGALAVLTVGTFFGYLFFYVPVRPIPITADRVLFIIVMAIGVAGRRFGWTVKTPWNKADVLLAALLLVLTASVAAGDWTYRGNLPASRLLFYYLMPAGMYWLTRQIALTDGQARLAFGVLALLGVYTAATAVAELFRLRELIFPRYIASSEHVEFFGRARGPFLNPASNGYFLSVGLCAAWMWWPRLASFGRALLAASVLLFVAGLYATLTRCVWMGALAMAVVVGGLVLPRAWRAPLVILPVVLAVGLAAVQWERLMELKRDEGRSAQEAVDSARLRPILAVVAWRMFLERPVFGCGFGHYNDTFTEALEDRSSDFPLDVARHYVQHNVLLGLLTETGLAGAGIFTALYCCWLADSWRLWRSRAPLWRRQIALLFLATSASYWCNAMFQDLAITPTVNMILFFLAGLARAAVPEARGETFSGDLHPTESEMIGQIS
ncbi:MAG: O-antigen ligase family protein [Pirellulales bacterium]